MKNRKIIVNRMMCCTIVFLLMLITLSSLILYIPLVLADPILTTNINQITPYTQTTSPLTITATADAGLDNVTLYFRWSSDNFTGMPVTSNLALHFDADAITGLNDNDQVAQWNDLSGNGYNATQTTSANRPLYKTNILNGKPIVRFDGSNDYLQTDQFATVIAQPSMVFLVWQTFATGTQVALDTVSGNRQLIFQGTSGGHNIAFNAGSTLSYDRTTPFNALISTAHFNGDSSQLWENGVSKVTGNAGINGQTELLIGIRQGLTLALNGDIAEIIIYDRSLSATERQQVEQYLGHKWLGWNSTGWTIWDNTSNADTTSPWSWDFDFPNETGYYEFFSIGAYNDSYEPMKSDAEAICYFEIVSPQPPTDFTTTTVDHTQIDLSWTKGINATHTSIEYNSTASWSRGQGSEIYNNTGSSYSHTDLEQGTTYYYQAWSYNSTTGLWNETYVSANNTTDSMPLTTSVNPIIFYNQTSSPLTITATGDAGLDNITLYYRYSNDNISWDSADIAEGGDNVYYIISDGVLYRVHEFISPVRATLDNSSEKLQSDTNIVDGHTIAKGDVVYVKNSSDPNQINNTYKANGTNDNWTWNFYGLDVKHAVDVEYLIVGGGGGAGTRLGGGGGAGGVVHNCGVPDVIATGFYPVRIGLGGTGGPASTGSTYSTFTPPTIGQNTIFWGATANGGGIGGGHSGGANGGNGGSGGGGRGNVIGATGGTGSQGNAGGDGGGSLNGAGGGGGHTMAGTKPSTPAGGNGGDGINLSAYFGTSVGDNGWFGGGGGGGQWAGSTRGAGGKGGGGDSGNEVTYIGVSGTPNTGGGGGSGMYSGTTNRKGGDGGSGIVIVRYAHKWTKWGDASNPDISSPWSWDFHFPNRTGYYEFFSIGAYNDSYEPMKTVAEALCYFEFAPPQPPIDFTATTVDHEQINLSWAKAVDATHTLIEWNITTTWTRGQGTEIYNSTGTSYQHTNLNPNTTYYYQAWSFNNTINLWNETYTSNNATTDPAVKPSQSRRPKPSISLPPTSIILLNQLFGLNLTLPFQTKDTTGDGNIDAFIDPNNMIYLIRSATLDGNIIFLLAIQQGDMPDFFWDPKTDEITLVTSTEAELSEPMVDEEEKEITIEINVEKADWIYIKIIDPYPHDKHPNFTLTVTTADRRVIHSNHIWREKGLIYMLDDPEVTYLFIYGYDELPENLKTSKPDEPEKIGIPIWIYGIILIVIIVLILAAVLKTDIFKKKKEDKKNKVKKKHT